MKPRNAPGAQKASPEAPQTIARLKKARQAARRALQKARLEWEADAADYQDAIERAEARFIRAERDLKLVTDAQTGWNQKVVDANAEIRRLQARNETHEKQIRELQIDLAAAVPQEAEREIRRLEQEVTRLQADKIAADGRLKALDRRIGELEAAAETWRDISGRALGAHTGLMEAIKLAADQDRKERGR